MKIAFNTKQLSRRLLCMLLLVCLSLSFATPIFAIEGTTYTYLISADFTRYLRTQDAYIPGGIYLNDIGLNSPEDMFLFEDKLYIADTGNARIVIYEIQTGKLSYLGIGKLTAPTGITVSNDGKIFVADYGASEIVVFSHKGVELARITRPTDILYGKSPYKPNKIGTDSFGNIFALSEGTSEGILQFNSDGGFNGFFGANKTKSLSLVQRFQKLVYTDEQKSKMFFHAPPNIASLDVSSDNLIYTVTQQDKKRSIKKLNLAGVDIFAQANNISGENNFVDIAVSSSGNIFAVTDTGSITEYDNEGTLLVMFGGRAASSDRNGLTAVVSAIETDDDCNLYILDKERCLVQIYYPTDYANLIHSAYKDYNAGLYENSLVGWGELLRMNPNTYMSHLGYGNSLFQLGRYSEASTHFKTIYRGDLYSDCFWEMRSEWLRSNMSTILIAIAIAVGLLFVLWLIKQRHNFMLPMQKAWATLKARKRIYACLFADTSYLIKHPIDCYYDIKHGTRGSVVSATILYFCALAVYMCNFIFGSFTFVGYGLGWFSNPIIIALTVTFPVFLFVIGSYLISSINNGEGSFKNVFVSCGYMFTPYIIFMPIMIILSHVMTYKEKFIYDFSCFLILGYTLVLLFLAVKETHCYTPKKTIGNLLLTIAFITITVIALVVLYILWKELFSFVLEIIEEVRYRVSN